MNKQKRKAQSVFYDEHGSDTKPRKLRSRWLGCLGITSVGLAGICLMLAVALAIIVWIILFEPEIFGMGLTGDLTMTAQSVHDTETALAMSAHNTETALAMSAFNRETAAAATAQYNNAVAFANESTRVALNNWQRQLDHDATRAALNGFATETAIAAANAQQATRAAFDFMATQTEVELEYQGTQTILNQNATALALGVVTPAPFTGNVLTVTPASFPDIAGDALLDDSFSAGLDSGLWQFASANDWQMVNDFLTARRDGAWLLTQSTTFHDYRLEIVLQPDIAPNADYFVILLAPSGLQDTTGIALRLVCAGGQCVSAELLHFARWQMLDGAGLSAAAFTVFQSATIALAADAEWTIRAQLCDGRVLVTINNQSVFDMTLTGTIPSGSVGVQVPEGAQMRQITLFP